MSVAVWCGFRVTDGVESLSEEGGDQRSGNVGCGHRFSLRDGRGHRQSSLPTKWVDAALFEEEGIGLPEECAYWGFKGERFHVSWSKTAGMAGMLRESRRVGQLPSEKTFMVSPRVRSQRHSVT
jgi:hypothetical protein